MDHRGTVAISNLMKDQIEAILTQLIGMALTEVHRAADMQMFTFGGGRDDEMDLHVQCPWRIERAGILIVGYRDMRDPPTGVPVEGFDPNEARLTRRDELLVEFVSGDHARPGLVVGMAATETGDVRLEFSDASVLSIFADSVAADDEYWRLLRLPRGDHYVVGGGGFEHVRAKSLPSP